MPLTLRRKYQNPDFWHVWGHSYTSGSAGPIDQTGRTDSMLRGAFDTEANNFQNHGVSGSRITITGRATGGWTRVMQEKVPSVTRGGPYAGDGGASLLFWGINDLGLLGNTTQMRAAWTHAMRSCISRARASTIWENDNASRLAYGAGFTNLSGTAEIGSGDSVRQSTVSGGTATVTLTLPADYKGETVVMQFWGVASDTGNGGTVTFTGTAIASTPHTGTTIYTGAAMPAATLSQTPIVKRFTGLTSAQAGQTIIATVSAIDASGTVYFDCAWLEPLAPPVVLVCGINRLTTSGYAFYGGWSGTQGQKDADVAAWNAQTVSVISEFDSMVQYVDIDAYVGNNTATTSDGIHPNEYGAGLIVDAMMIALGRIAPTSIYGITAGINAPSRRSGQMLRPRLAGHWYTADARQYGAYTPPVSGDMFAIPFQVTSPRDRYNQFGVEVSTAGSVNGAIRWGIYDDVGQSGYPQCLVTELSSGGAFTVSFAAAAKPNTANAYVWIPDPGLYWLVTKITTTGTGIQYRAITGPSTMMPNASTGGQGNITPSGWKLTGQGTTAFPAVFPAGAALSDNCPAMFAKLLQVNS